MRQNFRIARIFVILASCLLCMFGTACGAEPEETASINQTIESEITTEPETDPPTDSPTEAPTDPPTDPPTEAPTDPPTDPPTEAPTDPPTDPPTEAPTDPPTDPPTEAPTEPPTIPPTDPPVIAEQPAAQPLHFVLNTDTNCVHINPHSCRAAEKIIPENYAEIDIWEEDLSNYAYVYWACGICTKSYADQLPKF